MLWLLYGQVMTHSQAVAHKYTDTPVCPTIYSPIWKKKRDGRAGWWKAVAKSDTAPLSGHRPGCPSCRYVKRSRSVGKRRHAAGMGAPGRFDARVKKRTPTSVLAPFLPGGGQDPTVIPNRNMGRVQKMQPGWSDHGDSDWLRSHERADRIEREAYGKPLVAAYRHILGPTPDLAANDTDGARVFLTRINQAIEQGGWTRSEWTRLRKMRDKWQSRAEGTDPRFRLVGNFRGGLDKMQTENVKRGKVVSEMYDKLRRSLVQSGD